MPTDEIGRECDGNRGERRGGREEQGRGGGCERDAVESGMDNDKRSMSNVGVDGAEGGGG
jgi:hypothetical protein